MKKRYLAIVGILTAALAVGGCGHSASKSANSASDGQYRSSGSSADYAPAESAAYEEDYDYYEADEESALGSYAEKSSEGGEGDQGSTMQQAQDGQKIVYTGELSIQTLEYDKAYSSIHAKIKSNGGFVESEDENDNDYNWYNYSSSSSGGKRRLYITARIPSEKFESFMNSLSGEGKVISRSVSAQNISQVYADTQTYKEALEKEQKRLLEMMDKAETIEDMIAVESRLSDVERQLNQYKTRLSTMDKQVEYSTVNISLEEVKRYSQEVQERTFAEQVSLAFTDAVESFEAFCKGIVLFVVRYFPYLIILLIVIVLIIRAARKARAKRIAMMMDPEYARAMTAKQRAKAEKIARRQAQKEAAKQAKKTGRVYKRMPAPGAADEGNAAGQPAEKAPAAAPGATDVSAPAAPSAVNTPVPAAPDASNEAVPAAHDASQKDSLK